MKQDWRVWQDPEVALRFAERRRGGLLGADAQIDTMLRLVNCVQTPDLEALDIGCGDGVLIEALAGTGRLVHGVALDGSAAMLVKARERLTSIPIEYIEADFNTPAWLDTLPHRRFDVVVSGFAIHHTEDPRKQKLYAEIFALLAPGGLFVNIEHVVSASPLGEELFDSAYAESLARYRVTQGENVTPDEVLAELHARPDRAANRLTTVETQVGWLRAIGFEDVDCYWKQFELAVLAGFRRRA